LRKQAEFKGIKSRMPEVAMVAFPSLPSSITGFASLGILPQLAYMNDPIERIRARA
jgi:hypothetical protein